MYKKIIPSAFIMLYFSKKVNLSNTCSMQQKSYDGPNAFRDYFKAVLEQEREEFENMGKQAPSGTERKIRALEKALQTVEQLSENYEANLANINGTAQAYNRTI